MYGSPLKSIGGSGWSANGKNAAATSTGKSAGNSGDGKPAATTSVADVEHDDGDSEYAADGKSRRNDTELWSARNPTVDAADEHSLPAPPTPSRSDAYSPNSESTSSDVDGDRQQPNAARSAGTDDDVDADDDDMAASTPATAGPGDDCAAGADVRRPLSAEMYFMASRSVVIFVSFSLCASTARCGTARLSASKASLISRIRLRSRAFAVFLRYLRNRARSLIISTYFLRCRNKILLL